MSKVKDAIYGFAVGDALGVPYEFTQRGLCSCNDMIGEGTWNQPKGTWSDDTSMVLATLDSLSTGYFDENDLMNKFLSWYEYGNYTPHGVCFDIGRATRQALSRFKAGTFIDQCGGTSESDNGNGALMRIIPFAFLSYDEEMIDRASAITHNTTRSKFACEMYIRICQKLIDGESIDSDPYLQAIGNLPRSEVRSTGYVLDSLIAALWCFIHTESYQSCVLMAVNLGGDTDTIAALAGGLAGIKYGYDSIPKKWIENLCAKDQIDQICDKFNQFIGN